MVLGDFIIGGVLGLCIDYVDGAAYVLKPTEVNVTLNALPAGVTAQTVPEAGFNVIYDITQPLTDSGNARICVICRAGGLSRVSDGENVIGVMRSNTYTCWERKPGQLTISITDGDRNRSMELKAEAGQTYYLRPARPLFSPLELVPVSERKVRKKLKRCHPTNEEDYIVLQN